MPEHLLIDELLINLKLLFSYTGMNLFPTGKIKDSLKFYIMFIINFLWLNTDVIGEVYWMIDGAQTGRNFTEITFALACTSLCVLADFKSFFHVTNVTYVKELIENLRNLEIASKENEDGLKSVRDEIVRKERKFLDTAVKGLRYYLFFTPVTCVAMPLVFMALHYRKTREVIYMLPYLIIYPFDPFQLKYWPFVYLHQIWSGILTVKQIGGADTFFYTCTTFISIQFKLLHYDFENCISKRELASGLQEDDEAFRKKLAILVRRHQNIIRSVQMLEKIYTKSTLFHFVSSSLLICLCAFNLTTFDDVAMAIDHGFFLMMNMLQIFLLCYFGDLIIRSSEKLSAGVYNSRWYLADLRIRKNLLVIQTRAIQPCKLTALGYADVGLEAFMKVLSTSWSYFALLQTVAPE